MPISTNAPTCRTSSKGIITPIVLAIGLLTCHAVVSAQSDLRLIEAVQQKNMVPKAGKLVYGTWIKAGRISFGMGIPGEPEGLKVGILVHYTSPGG